MKLPTLDISHFASKAFGVLVVLLTLAALFLSVRGFSGTPTATELLDPKWTLNGPLELSPERGRFALLYSFAEEASLIFSLPVAKLAVPDLAMNAAGDYVSMFAPAVSFIAVPGYWLGKQLGASQIGAYAVITFFALLNFLFIASIARKLGAARWAAWVGALTFSLATPAFAYAGTLYQHHITVFLLLLSLWTLMSFRNLWSLAIVWFACAASVVVDNPNIFLMFPVGLFALIRMVELILEGDGDREKIRRTFMGASTFLIMLFPIAFFLWYNHGAYGDALQLPGTLQGVDEIGPDGRPATVNTYEEQVLTEEQLRAEREGQSKEKTAISFFETRNMYNGFYIHFISPDRGIISFTPVILIGIVGLALLYRRNRSVTALITACIGVNVILYSMWGDPWGGWAFGSRYLIPTYALLALGIALALSYWRYSLVTFFVFIPLFVFSLWVNSLGAVTSLANPPRVEVLGLEKQSGREQKYTFLRNWEFLTNKYGPVIGSKAFVYQEWGSSRMTPRVYHRLVFGLGLSAFVAALFVAGWPWQRLKNVIKKRV